jgi:hypothetical protein
MKKKRGQRANIERAFQGKSSVRFMMTKPIQQQLEFFSSKCSTTLVLSVAALITRSCCYCALSHVLNFFFKNPAHLPPCACEVFSFTRTKKAQTFKKNVWRCVCLRVAAKPPHSLLLGRAPRITTRLPRCVLRRSYLILSGQFFLLVLLRSACLIFLGVTPTNIFYSVDELLAQ